MLLHEQTGHVIDRDENRASTKLATDVQQVLDACRLRSTERSNEERSTHVARARGWRPRIVIHSVDGNTESAEAAGNAHTAVREQVRHPLENEDWCSRVHAAAQRGCASKPERARRRFRVRAWTRASASVGLPWVSA